MFSEWVIYALSLLLSGRESILRFKQVPAEEWERICLEL